MGNKSSQPADETEAAAKPSAPQTAGAGAPAQANGGEKKSSKENKAIPDPGEIKTKPVHQVVCEYSELNDGEMKEIEVEGQKVLLARDRGTYYALSSKCTHFGASLAKGALCKGRVRCPWHGACFDLATGDIEDFPGLDSLQTFEVEVKDGKVAIHTDTAALSTKKRVKSMMTRDLECTLLFLIVGGGPAAMECAEALRQEGYKGKILIMTMENDPPYDRTKLSKAMTSTGADLALRPEEFYNVYDISIMTGMEAFEVNTDMNHMVFRGREWTDYTVEYDQAVICTGSKPIKLDKPGAKTFPNQVYYLRTPQEANTIANNSAGKNVVIVGSSFIGMEVAAFLVGKAKTVTILGRSAIPFANLLGERIGKIILALFESKGVKMLMNSEVEELIGNEEHLTQIKLKSGDTIPADLCLVGIGVSPNTSWLEGSGVKLSAKGHVIVNKYNKTNIENIHAAGDCTTFPLFLNGEMVNVGHFQMSLAQGKSAGMNVCCKEEPLKSVPYFWTAVFGKSFRYCGYGNAVKDEVVFHGEDTKFAAFYIREEQCVAAATLGWDPIVSIVAELMHAGITIPAAKVRENPDSIGDLIPK